MITAVALVIGHIFIASEELGNFATEALHIKREEKT